MTADIKSFTRVELVDLFQSWDQPPFRVDQLLNWLYAHRITQWNQISNLPRRLLDRLARECSLRVLELVRLQGSRDSTLKFLWRLHDGALIESVLIPANPALYGEPRDRQTLCISTQVGCAYGCQFCASGLDGWKRHLAVEEIVEQVIATERWNVQEKTAQKRATVPPGGAAPRPDAAAAASPPTAAETPQARERRLHVPRLVDNLVVMGMGEPLANHQNLFKALRILNAGWGGGIGARKITISTSGLAPQIRRLARETSQFGLAVSLHAATDEIRNRLMPINRKYPLSELIAACEYYLQQKGRMITLEYILIAGVNDDLAQVKPLADLARRLRAKVNLIPYNHVEGLPWQRPDDRTQEAFLKGLNSRGVPATLRREKGHDIAAACGQLRLKTEQELAPKQGPSGAQTEVPEPSDSRGPVPEPPSDAPTT